MITLAVVGFLIFVVGVIVANIAKDPPTANIGMLFAAVGFLAMAAAAAW